jgi:hypothetical protein
MSLSDEALLLQLLSHFNKNIQVYCTTFFIFKGSGEDEVDTKQDGICESCIIGDLGFCCLAECLMD